jgi:hypothetical protein
MANIWAILNRQLEMLLEQLEKHHRVYYLLILLTLLVLGESGAMQMVLEE